MWVIRLGVDDLIAIGFIIPVHFIILDVGMGLSAGSASVIAKYIEMKDHGLANNTAFHSVLLIFISVLIIIIVMNLIIGKYIYVLLLYFQIHVSLIHFPSKLNY